MSRLSYVFAGVTAVAGIAAIYFGYRGYVSANKGQSASDQASLKKQKNRAITWAPTIYPDGAGVGAVIQF